MSKKRIEKLEQQIRSNKIEIEKLKRVLEEKKRIEGGFCVQCPALTVMTCTITERKKCRHQTNE